MKIYVYECECPNRDPHKPIDNKILTWLAPSITGPCCSY